MTVLGVQTLFAGLNIAPLGLVRARARPRRRRRRLGLGARRGDHASLAQVPIVLKLVAAVADAVARARSSTAPASARLIGVNRDIMIRSFALLFAFAFFTRQGARFGEVILAANAILMHFFVVGGYFLDGFATAAEQLAGRAVGARFRPAFERVVRLTTLWGLRHRRSRWRSSISSLGPAIIDLMTTAPEVRDDGAHYLLWAALTPIVGADRLPDGRHLHRRHLVARHAQHDARSRSPSISSPGRR